MIIREKERSLYQKSKIKMDSKLEQMTLKVISVSIYFQIHKLPDF